MPLTKIQSLGITDGAIVAADIASGAITAAKLASGVGGKVLQVITATDSTERSTTSTSFVTGSNTLSVSITPSSASNKIFVITTFHAKSAGGTYGQYTLYRNSTNLSLASSGTGSMAIIPAVDNMFPTAMSIYDSPATTSSTTYQVYMKVAGSGTVYVGGSSAYTGTTSSITAFEIAG
jgi:hypothetical protein